MRQLPPPRRGASSKLKSRTNESETAVETFQRCNSVLVTRDFSLTIAHGDLIARNVLFEDSRLTGVIDFDSTHVDYRAADLACARRSRHDDVVRGYLETSPLSDAELHSLGDLWEANVLRYVGICFSRRRDISASELAWCVTQLQQTRPFDM